MRISYYTVTTDFRQCFQYLQRYLSYLNETKYLINVKPVQVFSFCGWCKNTFQASTSSLEAFFTHTGLN